MEKAGEVNEYVKENVMEQGYVPVVRHSSQDLFPETQVQRQSIGGAPAPAVSGFSQYGTQYSSAGGAEGEADGTAGANNDAGLGAAAMDVDQQQQQQKGGKTSESGSSRSKEKQIREYPDTDIDRDDRRGMLLFPSTEETGYGRPLNTAYAVLDLDDKDEDSYFVSVDCTQYKYSDSTGAKLGFLIKKETIRLHLEEAKRSRVENGEQLMLTVREKLLDWMLVILQSPLSAEVKQYILRSMENIT